jgi:Protein of unknown function (DUF2970)
MRGFFAAVRAVLSAFIGIRKRGAANDDQSIKPIHLLFAALVCVALLVTTLIIIVRNIV